MLKGSKKFEWTDKYEQAFLALKEHLERLLLLSNPIEGEKFYLYLVVSEEIVSVALVKEEEKVQWSAYYVGKRLLDAETRYPELEKLVLALMVASRKLRPYFHAHLIEVLTNYTLRQVLQKLEASGRLLKWAIELGQFKVNFHPRTAIKGQALTDFIAEFTYSSAAEVTRTTNSAEATKAAGVRGREEFESVEGDAKQWTLYVDGAFNDTRSRSRASMMLISLEGNKIHCAIHFGFKTSNNEAEYEALILGLHLARELQAHNVKIFSNSQLIVNQMNDIYLARGKKMIAYLNKANEQLSLFSVAFIEVIPQSKNSNADALTKMVSTRYVDLLDAVFVEYLAELSIHL